MAEMMVKHNNWTKVRLHPSHLQYNLLYFLFLLPLLHLNIHYWPYNHPLPFHLLIYQNSRSPSSPTRTYWAGFSRSIIIFFSTKLLMINGLRLQPSIWGVPLYNGFSGFRPPHSSLTRMILLEKLSCDSGYHHLSIMRPVSLNWSKWRWLMLICMNLSAFLLVLSA